MAASPLKKASASYEKRILKHFPDAMPQPKMLIKGLEFIKSQLEAEPNPSQQITDPKFIFATSCCSDEINRDLDRDIEGLFHPDLHHPTGRVFVMGGLAGFPFVGKTGFDAFMHHVPERGVMVVICASHIGINQDGILGKVRRPGMCKESDACGSAIGALKPPCKELDQIYDFQQQWVLKVVQDHINEIDSPDPNDTQKNLTTVISRAILEYLEEIIPPKLKFPLAILSGIQINVEDETLRCCEQEQTQRKQNHFEKNPPPDYFYLKDLIFRPANCEKSEQISLLEKFLRSQL